MNEKNKYLCKKYLVEVRKLSNPGGPQRLTEDAPISLTVNSIPVYSTSSINNIIDRNLPGKPPTCSHATLVKKILSILPSFTSLLDQKKKDKGK